jgi:hypothetical protein
MSYPAIIFLFKMSPAYSYSLLILSKCDMLVIRSGVDISHGSLSFCNVPSNETFPRSNIALMIDQI